MIVNLLHWHGVGTGQGRQRAARVVFASTVYKSCEHTEPSQSYPGFSKNIIYNIIIQICMEKKPGIMASSCFTTGCVFMPQIPAQTVTHAVSCCWRCKCYNLVCYCTVLTYWCFFLRTVALHFRAPSKYKTLVGGHLLFTFY